MLDLAFGLFAQAASGGTVPAQGAPEQGGFGAAMQQMLFVIGITLILAWFIIIRPAQKQDKDRKKAIYMIKKGDEVTFSGGILGTVAGIKEKTAGTPGDNDEITVKVLETKLRILRSSIYAIVPASEDTKESATA